MHITAIGMNATTAPIALREQLGFLQPSHYAGLDRLRDQLHKAAAGTPPEVVVLSTCHRVEIYATCSNFADCHEVITYFLSDFHCIPTDYLTTNLYRLTGESTVHHLFRVAAGLDSPILGEPQILGQVADALRAAQHQDTVGPYLSALFQQAIHAAKRVHHRTNLGHASLSVGRVAAMLGLRMYKGQSPPTALVLGAGKMARLAAYYLHKHDAVRLLVLNRSRENGQKLAQEVGGVSLPWDDLPEALVQADIFVCATGAPHLLLHAPDVAVAMRRRNSRPLVILDISVPRNVDPEVRALPNVHLVGIDDIRQVVDEGWKERKSEVPKAEAILEEESSDYLAWQRTRSVVPVIRELREQAEIMRQQELARFLGRLGPLGEQEREQLEALTHRLMNKLLHLPTVRLKEHAITSNEDNYIQTVCDLFGLNGAGQDQP